MSICTHGIFTIYECKPNSPIQCAECYAPFLDIHLLEEHICEYHLDCWVPYKCVACQPSQHFTTELVLKMHMKFIHGTNKPIITYLSSEEKREKLHHLLVRSLIRSGTGHSGIQSRWQADPTSAAPLVELSNARSRATTSLEPAPKVHFAPSSSLVRSGVGMSRQPTTPQMRRPPDPTPAPQVALPRAQPRSRPTSYVSFGEEPIVHSATSSSAGTVEPGSYWRTAASSQQDAKVNNRSRMQPVTTNFTTFVPAGVKTATVDTTYRIGPRHLSKESPEFLPSSRSRARTVSPPLPSYRNPHDSSLDEQVLVLSRSRDDAGPSQRIGNVRNRRDHSTITERQIMPRGYQDNQSLIGKIDYPQSWNEPPRMENSISLDNLHLHLKTDGDTMKNLVYRITVTEEREQQGRRYDDGPSSTAV